MSPSASIEPASTVTDKSLPGHVYNITPVEKDLLKKIWSRLFELFKQKGTEEFYPPVAAKEVEKAKKGWFGLAIKEAPVEKNVFIGTTTNPSVLTLALDKALPLIPGSLLHNTFWNMVATDNPDAVLLRFLRARKWELDNAYNMLTGALRWRLVMRIDDVVALGETGLRDELNKLDEGMGDSFIKNLECNKVYLGGPDKGDRGICFINVRYHDKNAQTPEVTKLLTMYIMETSRVIVHQPVESACIVFNMDGFALKNMDFDFVKFLVGCFEAYYPETLGSCVIHKSPFVFSGVWNLISPLLDPVVATKIHFTKDIEELEKYVAKTALPSFITGDNKTVKEDISTEVDPVPPGALSTPFPLTYQEMIQEYIHQTGEWCKVKSSDTDANADSADRHELARKYRVARFNVELEIRGPTSYQAKGLVNINPDGRVFLDYQTDGWTPLDITELV